MTRHKWASLLALAALAASSGSRADWSGKAELGGSIATGNSENQSVNGAFVVKNAYDQWETRARVFGQLRQ